MRGLVWAVRGLQGSRKKSRGRSWHGAGWSEGSQTAGTTGQLQEVEVPGGRARLEQENRGRGLEVRV